MVKSSGYGGTTTSWNGCAKPIVLALRAPPLDDIGVGLSLWLVHTSSEKRRARFLSYRHSATPTVTMSSTKRATASVGTGPYSAERASRISVMVRWPSMKFTNSKG